MAEAAFWLVRKAARARPQSQRLRGVALRTALGAAAAELLLAKHRVAAAERCLSLAVRFLPCRAALVRHGPLVVAARGDAADLLLTRYEGRLAVFGAEALTVSVSGRAVIELCDPLDGTPFEAADCVAMRQLGQRYAVVLDAFGVVPDAADLARYILDRESGVALAR